MEQKERIKKRVEIGDIEHILPVVLFSSTITVLIVLSIARYNSLCYCHDLDVERWQSPSTEIIGQTLEQADKKEVMISHYDDLFRTISNSHGTDWRLMSAIAYAESRFEPQATSHFGARGLMQVMPRSAEPFGVSDDMLHDPEANIWVANLIFKHIDEMLKLPQSVSQRDRLSLILAGYNCGVGRIFDAQRLARSEDRDPYKWSNISQYLRHLNLPEYYNRSEVYHGRFSGASRTIAYIEIVLNTYDSYRRQDIGEMWQFVWR